MYVLPKGLESAWVMAKGKGLVFGTGNFGDILVCVFSFLSTSRFHWSSSCLANIVWDGYGNGTSTTYLYLSPATEYQLVRRVYIRSVSPRLIVAIVVTKFNLQNDPQHLSGLVRRILYQFVGPN